MLRNYRNRGFIAVWVVWVSSPLVLAENGPLPLPADRVIDFGADVQPILRQHCYRCHGPAERKGDLRLDQRAAAQIGGQSGRVILRGRSAESRLIQLVAGLDADLTMPLDGDRLSADQIGILRAWIDQGAMWPDSADADTKTEHWAYEPPVRPPLPKVRDAAWPRNGMDHFVLARLEREGLSPSPVADRVTLLRRASLDLTGLPPTIEEVDAFLADTSPTAYEAMIDRLLDSPHYGERWARLWLDLARYADTNGYEKDAPRTMWRYRDWVIDAFNRDLPFDQFTIEQFAGDMLPDPDLDQLIATGFHRNTMTNTEGGTDNEEFRVEAVVDRVDTTMQVWMGTTFGCARCHAHKYDPFSQREYYQVLAFLNNTADNDADNNAPFIEAPTRQQNALRASIESQIAPLQQILDTPTPELAAAQAQWEERVRAVESSWTVLEPAGMLSTGGATLERQPDHSIRVSGNLPPTDSYTIVCNTDLSDVTAFRLELLVDDSLPKQGPGRNANGHDVVSEIRITAAPADGSSEATPVALQNATADREAEKGGSTNAIDSDDKTGWAAPHNVGQSRHIVFEATEAIAFEGGAVLTFTIEQKSGDHKTVGRLRLSATTIVPPVRTWDFSEHVRDALDIKAVERTEEQREALAAYYRSIAPQLEPIRQRIAALEERLPKPPTTLVMQTVDSPRKTHVMVRGNFLAKGDEVAPAVPTVLHDLPETAERNRFWFARWLVSPDNPLVGRVMMNRFWEQFFGVGLVKTSEDFGTQGEPPSHPQLLDWLATEFVRQGWSMKAMHRLIVTSATYRQSSHVTPELTERDPYNRLLARGPRFRLPAETVRDRILAAAGLLSPKLYGPSVMPPQPDGVWQVVYSGHQWETSGGADKYRRGLYTFWRRTSPHPAMVTFDAPSREVCTVRRARTNTPLQALVLLNDPQFVEAAQALARRIVNDAEPDASSRLVYGFRRCLGRRPRRAESDRLLRLLDEQRQAFEQDREAATAMCGGIGPQGHAEGDLAELAAWTVVANVLLNLDEMIVKD